MINKGIPIKKYHFLVLCLEKNIPAYTPKAPKAAAMKNSNPSDILSVPCFTDLILSIITIEKATKLIKRKAAI